MNETVQLLCKRTSTEIYCDWHLSFSDFSNSNEIHSAITFIYFRYQCVNFQSNLCNDIII